LSERPPCPNTAQRLKSTHSCKDTPRQKPNSAPALGKRPTGCAAGWQQAGQLEANAPPRSQTTWIPSKHDGPQACSPQRHQDGKGCLPCGAGAGAAQSSLNAHAACLGEPTPSFASCRRAQRSPSSRRAHTAVSRNLAPCLRDKATALQAASCCTDGVLCLQSNKFLYIHAVAAWVKRRSGLRPVAGGAPPSDVFSTAAILGLQLPSTLAARASASARPPQRRNRTGSRGSLLGTAGAQQHALSVTCSGSRAAP